MKKAIYMLFRRISRYFSKKGLVRLPGAQRVYDSIDRRLRPGIILIELYGSKVYVNAKDTGIVPFLLAGDFEEYQTRLFMDSIKPGMVFVDAGANFGYYSLIAAGSLSQMGGEGEIYAFEPEPKNFELLLKNIEINGYDMIRPERRALSATTGQASLYLDPGNLGAHSLSSEWSSPGQEVIQIDTISLDDFFLEVVGKTTVDIIKIDTQGAEGLVFNGAWKTLDENRAKIFMEFDPRSLRSLGTDPASLLSMIADHGYSIKVIDEESRQAYSADTEEIIQECEQSGCGYKDLLLEKMP
jgi:FkbM family methyltransferase